METKTNYLKKTGSDLIITNENNDVESHMVKLPPGIYSVSDVGRIFATILAYKSVKLQDSLVQFKEGTIAESVKYINEIFKEGIADKYNSMGIAHKVGILYYGPQGTGKTSACQLVMDTLVKEKQAICLDLTGKTFSFVEKVVSKVREFQDNLIVLFCDEIDNSFGQDEGGWLTFLDGSHSISNFVLLGATNNLEEIPERIRNRKSRIKHCIEVKSLPFGVYKQYASEKCTNLKPADLDKYAYLAVEHCLTIDEFKNVLIDINIFDSTVDKAFEEAKLYAKV